MSLAQSGNTDYELVTQASSITYIGYVGVLTGVRKGLSISLNFRPTHDSSGRFSNLRFYTHHLLVLLGYQPSISSILRGYLLPDLSSNNSQSNTVTLESIKRDIPYVTTTAAYLIFCDGDSAITIEKDHHDALIREAKDFIVATNHDVADENPTRSFRPKHEDSFKTLLDGIIVGSISRRAAVVRLWEKSLKNSRRKSLKRATAQEEDLTKERIIGWMNADPILNEETHFATIMDPKAGKVVWTKRYLEHMEWD